MVRCWLGELFVAPPCRSTSAGLGFQPFWGLNADHP